MARPKIEIDENFETAMICALRYCHPRQSYMPGLIIDYIYPMLQKLSIRFLTIALKDIESAKDFPGLGDPKVDTPKWEWFADELQKELDRREANKNWGW